MTDRRRFEFRYETNGAPPPDFAGGIALGVGTRTDIYLLRSERPDLLPKLRGETRLQVKRLLASAGPLQYWGMPFDASGSAEVLERLLPGLITDRGPKDLAESAKASPQYRVIEVAKQRRLFQIGQIRAEITAGRVIYCDCRFETVGFEAVGFEADRSDELTSLLKHWKIADRQNRHYGMLLLV